MKTNKIIFTLVLAMLLAISFGSSMAFATDTGPFGDEFDVNVGGTGDDVTVDVTGATESGAAWQNLITKYKGFIIGISAVAAVTMVVLFIMQFLKLGASAGNPNARSQALVGVLWTGIAAALLGAVAVITGIFYNAI